VDNGASTGSAEVAPALAKTRVDGEGEGEGDEENEEVELETFEYELDLRGLRLEPQSVQNPLYFCADDVGVDFSSLLSRANSYTGVS